MIKMRSWLCCLFILAGVFVGAETGSAGEQRIKAGDLLQVTVFQEPDLSVKVRVEKDGTVRLPLIGNVRVTGGAESSAASVIKVKYDDGYLVNPQVTVTVITYSKERFTILGQVNRPGAYNMPDTKSLSLLQAIGMAGSYTRMANSKKVLIKRVVGGKERVYQVDANAIARTEKKDVAILAGDVITIRESVW